MNELFDFFRHDEQLLAAAKQGRQIFPAISSQPLKTQQFSVKLEFVLGNYQSQIPPVIEQCVNYLRLKGL